MSVTRWPWADHLSRKEVGELGSIEAQIKWFAGRGLCSGPEIDALKASRQRIVNRGTQRARLVAKRGRRSRPYRKAA